MRKSYIFDGDYYEAIQKAFGEASEKLATVKELSLLEGNEGVTMETPYATIIYDGECILVIPKEEAPQGPKKKNLSSFLEFDCPCEEFNFPKEPTPSEIINICSDSFVFDDQDLSEISYITPTGAIICGGFIFF